MGSSRRFVWSDSDQPARGSVLVETSLALGLIVVLLSSIGTVGFSLRDRTHLVEAMRVAARAASLNNVYYQTPDDTSPPPGSYISMNELVNFISNQIRTNLEDEGYGARNYRTDIVPLVSLDDGMYDFFVRIRIERIATGSSVIGLIGTTRCALFPIRMTNFDPTTYDATEPGEILKERGGVDDPRC